MLGGVGRISEGQWYEKEPGGQPALALREEEEHGEGIESNTMRGYQWEIKG